MADQARKKKALFLDDAKFRAAHFKGVVEEEHDCEVKYVETVAECIAALKGGRFDLVSLDSRLEDGEEGLRVVEFLAASRLDQGAIIVHSSSTGRGKQMEEGLRAAGYSVFREVAGTDPYFAKVREILAA